MRAKNFFSEEEKQRIEAAVREAESRTAGEIVPMVVDESYDYPRAETVGAAFFSLAVSVTLAWAFGGSSVWVFLPLFFLFYFPFLWLIRNWWGLRRRLVPTVEMDVEVAENALVCFLEHGLHRTRAGTGILILISLFEHRVYVLADYGINAQVPPRTWEEIVHTVTAGIHQGNTAEALCAAITRCGDLLQEHFPRQADDIDELPNLII
ncbi:MAG: TPM domain-containing protein [Desulfuromonadales bacterium]|nr:TPM domain-containing protein [Desulfuromonadales bacterium]